MSSDLSEVREEGKPCIWKYICLMYGRRFQAVRIACAKAPGAGMCLAFSGTDNSDHRVEGKEMRSQR